MGFEVGVEVVVVKVEPCEAAGLETKAVGLSLGAELGVDEETLGEGLVLFDSHVGPSLDGVCVEVVVLVLLVLGLNLETLVFVGKSRRGVGVSFLKDKKAQTHKTVGKFFQRSRGCFASNTPTS